MNDAIDSAEVRFKCSVVIDHSINGYPVACQRPAVVIALGYGGLYCAEHRSDIDDYPPAGPIVSVSAVPDRPVTLLEGNGYRVILGPNLFLCVEAQQGKDALGKIPWVQVLRQGLLHPEHMSKRSWRALQGISRQIAIDYLVAQGRLANG